MGAHYTLTGWAIALLSDINIFIGAKCDTYFDENLWWIPERWGLLPLTIHIPQKKGRIWLSC